MEEKDSSKGPNDIRVIKMTDRAPLSFDADEWPVLDYADDGSMNDLQPGSRFHARQRGQPDLYFLMVRQHADGQSLIYDLLRVASTQYEQPARAESFHAGYLVQKPFEIVTVINLVGEDCELPEYLIRDCISKLASEEFSKNAERPPFSL